MDLVKLKSVLQGEPKFRYKQVWQAMFRDFISTWQENTTLPITLREKLDEEVPLDIDAQMFGSKDNDTIKALITLEDKNKIETVLLTHIDGRHTVCVSSQVGCPLACEFCATGKLGFKRNLTAGEIVDQILFFNRHLLKTKGKDHKTNNVVFMGMGEPFLNYDNVMEAVRIINDKDGLNIGARHISISTSGIIDGINKFAKEDLQVNLAISLHAANDKLRAKLMPIDKKYPLGKMLRAVKNYVEKTDRQVMFEYLMIDGVNDTDKDVKDLIAIMDQPLYMVNLIRYNPTGGSFQPSTNEKIKKFKNALLRAGVKATQRYSMGDDIDAACGQLSARNAK
ncbi:MAG TPA: 23S rRNA (adenine(2503)-C(2))-methyltransferase RlmN [Candidatus Magasanikbacteria bacterium]|nr:23S rRNA (adenine(2503)-C(2))-methyltransferase RlmN [Candidatus Magasanikbacteria bacterium]